MAKKLTNLQKYNKIYLKYRKRIKKLAENYVKEVAKALNCEIDTHYFENNKEDFGLLYYIIEYNGTKFQAGDFDPYFYSGYLTLKEYLEKQEKINELR